MQELKKNRRHLRMGIIEKHIQQTAGIEKAYKQLNNKKRLDC